LSSDTMVGTALPTIVSELKGFDLYAWVATAYLLTSVITVPIFGRLGDYYGRKPFVIAAIVVFTAASVICGMSTSMLFLVLARGLQGIGGGMLVGTAFASVPDLFPDARLRLRWQVVLSSVFGIANAIGPSLGGFMTQYYGWRSVFYVNLPVGLISLLFVLRYLPHLRQSSHRGPMRLDWPGALLIASCLGCLQLFVEMLPKHGISASTASLLGLSIASGIALWKWEAHAPQPMLPLDLFRNPRVAPLFVLALLAGFTMFSLLVYTPLLFQGGFGFSPKDAGLVITPLVACITLGSIANGRLIIRIPNPTVILYVGFGFLAASCLGMVVSSHVTPRGLLMFWMLLGGVGLGLVLTNLTIFAQQSAGREHLGIATALMQSLRMIGGMLGTAITGTLVGHLYASGVRANLATDNAQQWAGQVSDPQILVNLQAQQQVLQQMNQAGHNGAMMLEMARESLVGAVHSGLAVAAAFAVIGIWRALRVPPVSLTASVEPPVMGE
jgi:EmrB/QacA subfamily drug resistance transporter